VGLFSVDYRDVKDQCIYAKGGLKFRADETRLRNYFSSILTKVTLNDLIGEAVFWILFPASLVILVFPVLLFFKGTVFAVVTSIVLYLILDFLHMILYIKPLNYFVFIFGNRILQFLYYIVWGVVFYRINDIGSIFILGTFILAFCLGLDRLISGIVLFFPYAKLFSPHSDQILRNVGWYYGRKYGQNPSSWKM
jgi:hypothetical protein